MKSWNEFYRVFCILVLICFLSSLILITVGLGIAGTVVLAMSFVMHFVGMLVDGIVSIIFKRRQKK